MFRKIILLGITAVLLSGCASTVKIEKGGLPGPNHMIIANLPSNGIRLNIGLVHHFRVEEGKEYLETFEYLNPSIEEHRITCGNTKRSYLILIFSTSRKIIISFGYIRNFTLSIKQRHLKTLR
jgi:hypothetical protein